MTGNCSYRLSAVQSVLSGGTTEKNPAKLTNYERRCPGRKWNSVLALLGAEPFIPAQSACSSPSQHIRTSLALSPRLPCCITGGGERLREAERGGERWRAVVDIKIDTAVVVGTIRDRRGGCWQVRSNRP